MRFITENDLRVLYRKEPFTEYDISPDSRLTPGARQFISDRRIRLIDPGAPVKKVQEKEAARQIETRKDNLLTARARALENLFLETGYEFLNTDVCLARDIMGLQPALAGIRAMLAGKAGDGGTGSLTCTPCTGINPENFLQDLGDCFEITPFHIHAEKGRQILMLNKLRCAMREFSVLAGETGEAEGVGSLICQQINQLTNTLSQMICTAFGGKECQRKN